MGDLQFLSDGKQVVFMGSSPGHAWKIYLISVEGGTPEELFPGPQQEGDPTWSPDGKSIVFGGQPWFENTRVGIMVCNLQTRQLTKLPGSDRLFSPRWSPDGRYIVAETAHTPPFALMLFDFATRNWTELANTPVGYPSWSRDTKYIYLQDWTDADRYESARIVRMRFSDRKLEPLIELKKVGRLTLGTITPWSGVAPDGSPLLTRDVSAQEIYSLDWHPP
jgi:Tol biopolymer transport system component